MKAHDESRHPVIRTIHDGEELQGILLMRKTHRILVEITHPYRLLHGEQALPEFLEMPEDALYTGPAGMEVAEKLLVSCFQAAQRLEQELHGVIQLLREEGRDHQMIIEHQLILQDIQREGIDISWKTRENRERFRVEYLATRSHDSKNHHEILGRFPPRYYARLLPYQAQVLLYHALEGCPIDLRASAQRSEVPSQTLDGLPPGMNRRVLLN
jgi:hypothetical protein